MTKIKKRSQETTQHQREDVHVKRNFVEDMLLNIKHYIQHNSLAVFRIAMLFLLGVVLVAGLYGVLAYGDIQAQEKLYLAQKSMQEVEQSKKFQGFRAMAGNSGEVDQALNQDSQKKLNSAEDQLIELVDSWLYSFSDASDWAHFELGRLYLMRKSYAKAARHFGTFVADNRGHYFAASAALHQGMALEQQSKYKEAAEVYHANLQKLKENYATVDLLYHYARMLEKQEKYDKAKKNYLMLVRNYGSKSSPYTDQAKKRLVMLGVGS